MILIAMIENDKSESCAICGERVDVLAGPALVTDTGKLVCESCTWDSTPELVAMLDAWESFELAYQCREAMSDGDDDD